MTDIRLEEMPFEFDGKTWLLRCNMNVLADVQNAYNGNISEALEGGDPFGSVLQFLAAMLNDYADEMGWPERYTARQLGRRYAQWMLPTREIMGLVIRSITPPERRETPEAEFTDVSETDTEDPGHPGN